MRPAILLALAAAASAAANAAAAPLSRPDPRYRLIVNTANPARSLPRTDVSRLFLKKTARWPDGRDAMPVDLADNQPAREEFSRHVHHKTVRSVKAYWQQMIFSGRGAPPPELATEADVIELVRANPNAIGYVSDEASLSGVKILDVVEEDPAP
jgi:hypothetical protein